jgi:hypothetical protein
VIDVLAAATPTLTEAMKTVQAQAFLILANTLLPTHRIAAHTLYHSGKPKTRWHERPGPDRPVRPTAVGLAGMARVDP